MALVLAAAVTAVADDKPRHRDRPQDVEIDQTEALDRLKRKDFKPLAEVIAAAQASVPGEIVRIKVKRVKDRLAYELRIITTGGVIREVYIDPTSLEILKVE